MSRWMWPVALSLSLIAATCTKPAPPDGPTCVRDDDCAPDEMCARDGECWRQDQVRMVRLTWTLRSQPASAQTCAATPELEIAFYRANESFGISQVTCTAGVFTVDKLPTVYTAVGLGRAGGALRMATFDASGNATIDLPY